MNFNQFKRVLVLAVGGGNDSVSTIMLQLQLNRKYDYQPEEIDIVAVLPDCLDYQNIQSTDHPLISIIQDNSTRSVQGFFIDAFPERILAQNKHIINELPVKNIFGISMANGSFGISGALKHLITNNSYDLILAIDVGGDFIAHKDNVEVLSPMMDGYMLFALKELQQFITERAISTQIVFSVFGLGTDGESTPEMLKQALALLPDIQEHIFNKNDIQPFIQFYRNIVEENRYSRTTDYTILEITEQSHENPSQFRGRFHVKTNHDEKSEIYYGNFIHYQSPEFFGKFYLFKDILLIDNLYSQGVKNGFEWFLNVQKESTKINHELNGQSYSNIGQVLNHDKLFGKSLFFGTPSRKFTEEQQILIAKNISQSMMNNIYDYSIIYNSYSYLIDKNLFIYQINNDLSLITNNFNNLVLFKKYLISI